MVEIATAGSRAAPARSTGKRSLGNQQVALLMIAPAVLLMCGFYVYPLLQVLWISFTEPSLGVGI